MSYEGFMKSGVIEDVIMEKQWTLNDLVNLEDTVYQLAKDLESQMEVETKIHIVGSDTLYAEGYETRLTLEEIICKHVRISLTKMIKLAMNEYMKTAKVEFNDINNTVTDEVVEKPVEPESEISEGLKEAMKADVKQLSKEDMEKLGMV